MQSSCQKIIGSTQGDIVSSMIGYNSSTSRPCSRSFPTLYACHCMQESLLLHSKFRTFKKTPCTGTIALLLQKFAWTSLPLDFSIYLYTRYNVCRIPYHLRVICTSKFQQYRHQCACLELASARNRIRVYTSFCYIFRARFVQRNTAFTLDKT